MGASPIYLTTVPTESVPGNLAGSACAIPIAIGENFESMGMPIIAGALADKFYISVPILIAGAAGIVGGLLGFIFIETAPIVVANKAGKAQSC